MEPPPAASFRPCLIIPIYNHGAQIGRTLAALEPFALPCFIVDDGSDLATKSVLDELAGRTPWVTLETFPENRGKGAAVVHGMVLAHAAGFTHALQIDADGQHESRDVTRFLERGAARPDAMILGAPLFDDTAPLVRVWGRKLTNLCVVLETLSFAIRDGMCGFRLYPLAPTVATIARRAPSRRMGFDTDLAVRLYWAGVPAENLATRVRYPPDGKSNFRMVRDNVHITFVHFRLLLGMLARAPWLLARRRRRHAAGDGLASRWADVGERGSILGLRFVYLVYRLLGHRLCAWCIEPVIAYFFVTGRRARRASRQYLERLTRWAQEDPARGPIDVVPGLWTSYRHFREFGIASLDKVAAWRGAIDPRDLEWHNKEEFEAVLRGPRGAFFVSAHLGNAEIGRALAKENHQLHINALMFTNNAQRYNQILQATHPDQAVRVIGVETISPSVVALIDERLAAGEFISVLADRVTVGASRRVVRVPFLGGEATFPQGPWILASLLGCPVYLVFFLRVEGGTYRVYFERFLDRLELPRREREERIRDVASRFARSLETYCRIAPLQWFNFYDFWSDAASEEPVA